MLLEAHAEQEYFKVLLIFFEKLCCLKKIDFCKSIHFKSWTNSILPLTR